MGLPTELGPRGQVDKYKARYVIKSFEQREWTFLRLLRLPLVPVTHVSTSVVSKAGPCYKTA